MEIHKGRLVDHIHLQVRDLAKSKAFYEAVLQPLGKSDPTRFAHSVDQFTDINVRESGPSF